MASDAVVLTEEERDVLTGWVRARTTPRRLVERARIVLAAADGRTPTEISQSVGATRATVYKWLGRFAERRIEGIEHELPGRGRKPSISKEPPVLRVLRGQR